MLNLNLPFCDFFLKKEKDKVYIKDLLKNKFLLLTPEEWVRQHLINYMVSVKSFPKKLISTESSMKYNKLLKRTDILVFDRNGQAVFLIECKASHIELDEKCIFQLSTYNSKIKAPIVGLSNGLIHYYWYMKKNKYEVLPDIPQYEEMLKLVAAE